MAIVPRFTVFTLVALLATSTANAQGRTGSPPHVVFIAHEDEYGAEKTLPEFAKQLNEKHGAKTTVLQGRGQLEIAGLEVLERADVVVLFLRRKGLTKPQMEQVRKYVEGGRPLIALRTSCHGFAPKIAAPGIERWAAFDAEVLGCHYHDHGDNAVGTEVTVPAGAAGSPLLRGVSTKPWHSKGSLYYILPLAAEAKVILEGSASQRTEPVAWTLRHRGGRVFATTLGHPDDFTQPEFCQFLMNAVLWATGRLE